MPGVGKRQPAGQILSSACPRSLRAKNGYYGWIFSISVRLGNLTFESTQVKLLLSHERNSVLLLCSPK